MIAVLLLALLFPISGYVKDSLGNPIPGARVKLLLPSRDRKGAAADVIATARTNESGGFSFPGFFDGPLDLNVEKEGFRLTLVTNIRARSGYRTVLSDIVMDVGPIGDPGEIAPYYVAPIPDSLPNGTSRPQVPPLVKLGVQISATGDWAFLARSETDENGRFIFSGLTAGAFDLYFQKEGFLQGSMMDVKAPAGQLTTTSDAVLHAAALACPPLIQVALPY